MGEPAKMVKIYIDGFEHEVPAGTNLVDAAKWIGNDIPVFCYHPKMAPVGMCRMCLVEMGSRAVNKETGDWALGEDGLPAVRMQPKLATACTTTVTHGLVVNTTTPLVAEARRNVIEFLLSSHPLDCPICDKGGECPLQNLTMAYGPGRSRMDYSDKKKLDKHVPLGDLIFLDEERCIQCARCIRFQAEVVGDDVLGFFERGRSLQIITNSDPPFDSYFGGNTTDICPVGALTTTDFRFGARPWELTEVPTICPHCPVGCNTTASTRLDRDSGGKAVIKRIMPRQNEQVNEIWICDKGRYGHHFTRSIERLMQPMQKGASGSLTSATWNEALDRTAALLSAAGGSVAALAGPGMSNEDLWLLRQVVQTAGGSQLGAWPPSHGGQALVEQVGVGVGTNLGDLGKGDAVLIIATDLEEEAPVWRLRIKQAHDRGAWVVVANARHTRMDDFSNEQPRYDVGKAAEWLRDLTAKHAALASKLSEAHNLVILAGAEGLTLDGSTALMQAAANFLIESGHVGKPNNGLIGVYPGANAMGLHFMGFSPEVAEAIRAKPPKVLIVAQADVMDDDPQAAEWLARVEHVISLSLWPDDVASNASVALPIQSFAERDGSYMNGERRVQRYYTAQGPMGEAEPVWRALTRLLSRMGRGRAHQSAAAVMLEITQQLPQFSGMRYSELAKVERQFPEVGGSDLYYGGTAYRNRGGLGVQMPTAADQGEGVTSGEVHLPKVTHRRGDLWVVPTTRLYNRERDFQPSVLEVMQVRVPEAYVEINAADAENLAVHDGDFVQVTVGEETIRARAHVNGAAPKGTVLLPRHLSGEVTPMSLTTGTVTKIGS
ncbi:MAG TPA: NADH-quinone oxidoreductase subunit NuoG [Candidatus Limnocylindrales bacterium]|nr:NADH-quinone oxidoreductase subunit NuoG [Candidatus Limnocylindrales bacterium]